jgi:hypothetical protein
MFCGSPEVGRPLPRAADAWTDEEKWRDWTLREPGHGSGWRRATGDDALTGLWETIAAALGRAVVTELRNRGSLLRPLRLLTGCGLPSRLDGGR